MAKWVAKICFESTHLWPPQLWQAAVGARSKSTRGPTEGTT